MKANEIVFASGSVGSEVRADGKGGSLDRGFWIRISYTGTMLGPFETRALADKENLLYWLKNANVMLYNHDLEGTKDYLLGAIALIDQSI